MIRWETGNLRYQKDPRLIIKGSEMVANLKR